MSDEVIRVVDRRALRDEDSVPRPKTPHPRQAELEAHFNWLESQGLNPKVEVTYGRAEIVVDPVITPQAVREIAAATQRPVRKRNGIPVFDSDRRLRPGEKVEKPKKARLMMLDENDLVGWSDN